MATEQLTLVDGLCIAVTTLTPAQPSLDAALLALPDDAKRALVQLLGVSD